MAAIDAVGRASGLEPLHPLEDSLARDLYERHARRVLAYCRSRLRAREDAEDAVQTTFMHAVGNLRRGDAPSHELAWLLGIARNVCLSRLETAVRRGRLELVCDPVDLERSEAPDGRRDELIGLEQALAQLPEQQRRAVLLRDWRGLSYEEVAAQLGVSLANAETLIFRGRRSLAALLDEQPAATRRRLASLGNTGSLLAWVKSGVGATAVASKLAAAAAVVAVSGAALATGGGAVEHDRPVPAPVVSRAPAPVVGSVEKPAPAVADTASPSASARSASARTAPHGAPAGDRAGARTPAAPETAGGTASGATPSDTEPAAPDAPATPPARTAPAAAAPAAPKPEKVVPAVAGAVGSTVGGVVETVEETVERLVPPLAPVLEPVTETVVEVVESVTPIVDEVVETVTSATVPPVTVPPVTVGPVTVPPVTVGPITVDPPKLLPRP